MAKFICRSIKYIPAVPWILFISFVVYLMVCGNDSNEINFRSYVGNYVDRLSLPLYILLSFVACLIASNILSHWHAWIEHRRGCQCND